MVVKRWHIDETYIKVKGQWVHYYRAVDENNEMVDFYLSSTRDMFGFCRKFYFMASIVSEISIKQRADKIVASMEHSLLPKIVLSVSYGISQFRLTL